MFWFSLQLLFEIFLILRRIQRHTVINVKTSSCKVPAILVGFKLNLKFSRQILEKKKAHISNLIKTRPVGVESFHSNGRADMKWIVAFRNFLKAPKNASNQDRNAICVTPGCRRGANEAFALLRCYAALTGSFFLDCLSLEDGTDMLFRNFCN